MAYGPRLFDLRRYKSVADCPFTLKCGVQVHSGFADIAKS